MKTDLKTRRFAWRSVERGGDEADYYSVVTSVWSGRCSTPARLFAAEWVM